MSFYDEQLVILRQQMERSTHIKAVLKDLYDRRSELEKKVAALAAEKSSEQEDVSRIEGRSLAAFFYFVIGKKGEKLEKEKKEAYEAAVRYDAALCELSSVKEDIDKYEKELHLVFDAHIRYEKMLEKKKAEIKQSERKEAKELFELDERIAVLKSQYKELDEAISEGKRAKDIVWELYSKLDSAETLGGYDMFGGKGMTSLMKYDYIDEAQELLERLQVQLSRFKSELVDVNINSDIRIEFDGFDRFADCFFDNIFTDWFVQNRIEKSKAQVDETRKRLEEVTEVLWSMLTNTKVKLDRAKERSKELVLTTDI